ncbi:Cell cycle serine/threonine-protein kinase cdc5/MSD2 [Tilletia horrida]|uniref:Cell cycle serine/threonine-protein kinase cdc5/MSD2 n=1 Tax=Tilletia horrida TaxID=155126 RepID=A0AAN6GSV9_9BASI|nr:Cell cycle serine/threonine-protein kinase cdc5/MSD2 [Tilletia horrida]
MAVVAAPPRGASPVKQTRKVEPQPPSPKKKTTSSRKPQLPSPPRVILDAENNQYRRGALLGQGGFARVYEVTDELGNHKAFKAIAKSAIFQSKKNRQKVLAEIMIHKSCKHPNIVRFEDSFEDHENVYFRLELCRNGSMNDIVKRRGKYTEAEARFFMVQIVAACQYMHTNSIIHRDLKLGNIFLDANMNVKIGDFGLAALLKFPEERKQTMCGTPNYIAPEVLFQKSGHSFEVDVWSVGVILYTLLVGKPPFQTNNVELIYEKIKKNEYEIPEEAAISDDSKDLIRKILTLDPAERPSLIEIMNHSWFRCGTFPTYVPPTAVEGDPYIPYIEPEQSWKNFELLKQASQWNPHADDPAEDEAEDADPVASEKRAREQLREQEAQEEQRDQMDKAFERAIQPGSPISNLIKAGRQPLVKAGQTMPASRSSANSLARQTSAMSISSKNQQQADSNSGRRYDKENAGPTHHARPLRNGKESHLVEERRLLQEKARLVSNAAAAPLGGNMAPAGSQAADQGTVIGGPEAIIDRLHAALSAYDSESLYEDPEIETVEQYAIEEEGEIVGRQPEAPRAFVISWLDESSKWGLAYALADGSVGCYFRDGSTMTFSANRSHFDFISNVSRSRSNSVTSAVKESRKPFDHVRRSNFALPAATQNGAGAADGMSDDMFRRVKIVRHLEQEIMERLWGGAENPLCWTDETTISGMPFVHKWYRCQQAIVFRLSNSVIQLNFYDHVKLFLSQGGKVISAIDCVSRTGGVPVMKTWTLSEFISIALADRSQREEEAAEAAERDGLEPVIYRTKPGERRFVRALLKKVRYARDELERLTATANAVSSSGRPTSASSGSGKSDIARPSSLAGIVRATSAGSMASAASTRIR